MLQPGHTPDEKGEAHLPRPDRRHQLLAADRSIRARRPVLRERARGLRDLLRLQAGVRGRAALHRRRAAAGQHARPESLYGAFRALDPATGERKWEFAYPTRRRAGILTTASDLLFTGDGEGNLLALDSRSGKLLWRYQMGATLHGTSPVTYMLDGRQHLLVPAGTSLTAWALPR